MSIYSNDNISKIAKLTTRELPHLAKTAKITVRENNGVYSTPLSSALKTLPGGGLRGELLQGTVQGKNLARKSVLTNQNGFH